ncbi:AMP-binding protein [Sphingomonas sp. GB1N7]|uniref:AMP-binding protein n=1 Tax=Parasphingomonas caseinilytica TaxID=3096158 RepID=UPI002FC61F68
MNTTPASLTGFEGQDIRTLLDDKSVARADHAFLVWEPFAGVARQWSYAEFVGRVRGVAAGLHARGVQPGQRVLIHLENCPEFLFAWFGCAYLGAVAVTTNTKSVADDIRYFAGHCGAVGGVTSAAFADVVADALGDGAWLVVIDDAGGGALEAFTGDSALLPKRVADQHAEFGIQYTSGTTARPKAVVWSHANALWGGRVSAMHEGLAQDDVHLVFLPLFHTNAQVYSVLASLWAGATVVRQPRFSASRFWPVSLRNGCMWTSVVPFCTAALKSQPVPARHSYRFFGTAVRFTDVEDILGVRTISWWGMTETVTHGIVSAPTRPVAPLGMGSPSPAYEILVLDTDMRPISPGEVGDLYVRGRRGVPLFVEYAGHPYATAAAFTPDGLFITGDRVMLGGDGSLFFIERAKDMLKVGGENVAASEIERVIAMVPGVREVAVAARPHPMLDEVPVAFVIADDDPSIAARIEAICLTALAPFKRPVEVRLVDDLPRVTLNKVSKAALRAMLLE